MLNRFLLVLIILFTSACQPEMMTGTIEQAENTQRPTFTPKPTKTSTPSPTLTPKPSTQTITEEPFQACCPLENETLETLPLILVNPLVIPPFGRDDGHHGLDFAYYRRDERLSIQGIEVYAILSGKTSLILDNETPYGYTIVIETPLSDLPESLQKHLVNAYQPIPEDILYQGECPEITPLENTGNFSVYHLYAHLEEKPTYAVGELIGCGDLLGTVGNSGRSSNPHLHLETRLGPSNVVLGDMAYYETVYSEEQRANYCRWRMSGFFQLFDAFIIFNSGF